MRVRRSNHTVSNVNHHFVWCPKYRNAVLDNIESSLEQSIRDVAERYGYDVSRHHVNRRFPNDPEALGLSRLYFL